MEEETNMHINNTIKDDPGEHRNRTQGFGSRRRGN